MAAHYGIADLARALRAVGLREGDVVFSHSNVAWFGQPDWARSAEGLCQGVWDAFFQVLGPQGTLAVPTFTYSFCKSEPFEAARTSSNCGLFAEWVRKRADALRSEDPIFSVAAVGPRARALTEAVPLECFGPGSFWERLIDHDGIVCNLNVFELGSTMFHYIERRLAVPYRYDKPFPGVLRRGAQTREATAIYFCNDLSNSEIEASNDAFSALAIERGIGAKAPVGRGYVGGVRARRMLELISATLPSRPWLLTRADGAKPEPVLVREPSVPAPALAPDASPLELVRAIHPLARAWVSDGIDAALAALGTMIPLTVHKFITGTHAGGRIVPERWRCVGARLATSGGQRVFDGIDRVPAYSIARRGTVSRDTLLAHLHVSARASDALPLVSLCATRDWGLCVTQDERNHLDAEEYTVEIDVSFCRGEMKIGECALAGTGDRWITLLATLEGGANAALSGVAVGVDVMRRLRAASVQRPAGVRLVILPEASTAAFAAGACNGSAIAIHLDMLGRASPPCLAGTAQLAAPLAAKLEAAMRTIDAQARLDPPGRGPIAFDAVPVVTLRRSLPDDHADAPFAGYRTRADTPEHLQPEILTQSSRLVAALVDVAMHSFKN